MASRLDGSLSNKNNMCEVLVENIVDKNGVLFAKLKDLRREAPDIRITKLREKGLK